MRNWLHFIIALLVAFLLGGIVWMLLLSQYTVSTNGKEPVFYRGDRVLVTRTTYGLRLPFSALWGYHRWGNNPVQRGEWIAFNQPDSKEPDIEQRPVCIARCTAVPGDTVWFTWNRRLVSSRHASSTLMPFVVPGWKQTVQVTSWNMHLLCNTLNLHEGRTARIQGDTLWVDNRPVQTIRMRQDYYWVASGRESDLNDSRYFGFVPETHLIGKARMVTFSTDPTMPLYKRFRNNRFFLPLP